VSLPFGVDPKRLDQAGWAIIFPAAIDAVQKDSIRSAMKPLLDLRRSQAGELYREYADSEGYRPGEWAHAFLARHGVGVGSVDPFKMPYYLLLVGDPETIPYKFESSLSIEYAVGRIDFGCDLEAFANYSRSVIAVESGEVQRPQRAVLFGVENQDDRFTYLSANALVKPMASRLAREQTDWRIEVVHGGEATKSCLLQLLGGDETPALLLTASHGLAFPPGHPRQLDYQGALLCQDWPGPRQWRDGIPREFYVAADDVGPDARLHGLIAFLYSAYSAGTPSHDRFIHEVGKPPPQIAAKPFLAALPKALLSHPQGGALAVVGHVDRAGGFSLNWERLAVQPTLFQSSLRRLMRGHPLGWAQRFFVEHYAALNSQFSGYLEDIDFGRVPDYRTMAGIWADRNAAESLHIVGDPAVRLPVELSF
jgi:hypothetical protein